MEWNNAQNQRRPRFFTSYNLILLTSCLFAALVSLVLGLVFGARTISLPDIFKAFLNSEPDSLNSQLIFEFRLPISLNALLYGAAMGAAGIWLQRLTRFRAICPYTLGLMPGAVLAIIIGSHINELMNEWQFALLSVTGAGFGLLVAWLFSFVFPVKEAGLRLLIGGLTAVGVLGLTLNLLSLKWDSDVVLLYQFQNGISRTSFHLIPVVLVCLLAATVLSGRMNASSLPIGLVVVGVGLSAVLAGTAAATLGSWTMVGLIASALARQLARSKDYRIILPVAALGGAVLVSLLNTLSFAVNSPFETPFRVVTGAIGLPLLAVLVWKEATLYKGERDARATE